MSNGVTFSFSVPAWCDADAVFNDVLKVMRFTPSDPDAERIAQQVNVAAALIDAWLDRAPDDPLTSCNGEMNPLARFAMTNVTIELYRRKDAPFGVLNAWSTDEIVTRINTDPIRGSFHILLPLKGRFGVAG